MYIIFLKSIYTEYSCNCKIWILVKIILVANQLAILHLAEPGAAFGEHFFYTLSSVYQRKHMLREIYMLPQ